MKLAMINGSPKLGRSNSSILIHALESLIKSEHEISHYCMNKIPLTKDQYSELCHMDTLVFAFPLYIDAIPSHLFRMLVALEEHMKTERKGDIYVYAIVNNGFYEGKQNHIAIDILRNWCIRCGLHFNQGIGHGAGEMMEYIEKVPLGVGPLKNLGKSFECMAYNIHNNRSSETALLNPNFPRLAWKYAGTHYFWNGNAKKNGLTKKDILRKL